MKKCLSRAATMLLASVVCLAGTPSAQSQSNHVEGAKKEGKVVWYTSMSINESKPLLDEFEKQYPFIKTELFRASTEKVLNRTLTETRAGRWEFDAVSTSGIDALIENKAISAYQSPEAKHYPAEFRDAEGYWTAIYNNYYVIGYNTQLVSDKDAPKSWEDLLDPKWKGKISIDQEEYEWYATLVKAWGKEKGQQYMRALAKQNIQWRKGHTLIAQLMAAGEFPVGIVYAHRVESMRKDKAPLEWVNTLNPVVATANAIGLGAKPRNPNAGKLLIDFVLSRRAQEMIRSFNRIPARGDVDPISPKMAQSQLKLKLVPHGTSADYQQTVKEFREIFGL